MSQLYTFTKQINDLLPKVAQKEIKKLNISTPKHPNIYSFVDADMYDELNQYKWGVTNQGYAERRITLPSGAKKSILLHRYIKQPKDKELVDHIDGNKLNNTKSNLRIATRQQNIFNARTSIVNTSGHKGVHWLKKFKNWRARIGTNGINITLGTYDSFDEALYMYNTAAKILHGEFCHFDSIPKSIAFKQESKYKVIGNIAKMLYKYPVSDRTTETVLKELLDVLEKHLEN